MNPLLTVRGAITTGFVAAVVLSLLISPTSFGELSLARWLHIVSGVLWIGLLYYFNLVQIPALAAAAKDKGGPGGAAITRYVHRARSFGSAGPRSPPGSRGRGTSAARETSPGPSRSASAVTG